jgi:hypothetical protein
MLLCAAARMEAPESLRQANIRSYSNLIEDRLEQLRLGFADDCERLAAEREEALQQQCRQLREENQQLKSKLNLGKAGGVFALGESAAHGVESPAQEQQVAIVDGQAGASTTDVSAADEAAEEAAHSGFAILPELEQDCVAGNVPLEEEYWIKNAARPDHDQAFVDTGSTFHEDEHVATMQGCVLNPASHAKLAWDVVGIPVLAWDLITIPMQVFQIGDTPLMLTMGWVTLIYWTIDIPVTFVTGYFNHDGDLIMSLGQIRHHYLRGFFFLDFIIIAADWVSIFIGLLGDSAPGFMKNMAIMRILRISRFVRLTRLTKLKSKWQTVEDNIDSEWVLVCLNLVTKICMIMSLNHYIGCCWYLLGNWHIPGYETWLMHHPYPQFTKNRETERESVKANQKEI